MGWLSSDAALSRSVHVFTPDELVARADVICNGIPTEITVTDERSEKQWSADIPPIPMRIAIAKVNVLALFKGELGEEIEIRFPLPDSTASDSPVSNGPLGVKLDVGQRYRFYLRQIEGRTEYVGALNGAYDDGPAMTPLSSDETDIAPPLLGKNAIQMAKAYLFPRSPISQYRDEWILPNFEFQSSQDTWKITFYSREPRTYPPLTSDAEIFVTPSGVDNANSWISSSLPITGKRINESYVGRYVRVIQIEPSNENSANASEAADKSKVLLGVIKEVSPSEVTGLFRAPRQLQRPQMKVIPKSQIEFIQPLSEPVKTPSPTRS